MYGKAEDVNKNSVVLKVNGNLTLDSGYTLTSVKSGTAVGKGLFIYCTGTATINGTVNMSGVTCTAEGQDVFLWKNRLSMYVKMGELEVEYGEFQEKVVVKQ